MLKTNMTRINMTIKHAVVIIANTFRPSCHNGFVNRANFIKKNKLYLKRHRHGLLGS